MPARVVSIEFDPNRSAHIAMLLYKDGERRYIIAPETLSIGSVVVSGKNAEVKPGNCFPIKNMPVGTVVHNIEIVPGAGAQIVRGAGSGAVILGKEGSAIRAKLPSGEVRIFNAECRATVGQVGNINWNMRIIGKAGRNRNLGKRPSVRGVAQNPSSHPHGGGEGRSGIGMKSPKSPWGKPTLGYKTRKKNKYSDRFILERRRKK